MVLVLTAALIAPHFIDWTNYRADFEREASAILGRKVTVEGRADARLLPFPSITFSDVTVGGGTGEPAMTIENFSMDAELAPFLRGEFLIFDMRIERPRAIVAVAANGTVDWAARPSTPVPASRIALEKVTITDGRVELRHGPSGRTHIVSEIDAKLAAKSLTGPWRLEGSMSFDGAKTAVTASTGAVDEQGRIRLRVRAAPAAHALAVDADGQVELRQQGLVYAGAFHLLETKPEDGPGKKPAGQKNVPGYRVNGQFSLDSHKLDVSAFRFETGPTDEPYTADGSANLDFGAQQRFAITASGAQVKFDEALGAEEGTSLRLEERIAAFERAVLDLPRPTIPGSITVNLPAIVAGDTTVRDVRLSAEPAAEGWSIRSFAATLPGRTTLEAKGLLLTGDKFGFNGSLLLAVAQPSGFAAWVAKDIDDAIRRLPAAGFSAKVEMSEQRQLFSDLELVLGNAKFRGEIDSRQPADARPSTSVKLDGDAMDVDGLSAFASLFVSDAGKNRFADTDLDLSVKAGPVNVAGLTAETLDTAVRLREGRLDIDRLSIGGLAGASISATGVIKDLAGNPTGDLDASVVAADLAPLVDVLAQNLPGNPVVREVKRRVAAHPGLLSDARLDVIASAAENKDGTSGVAISLQGNAGGSALSASLWGNGSVAKIAEAELSILVSARNEDAAVLLAAAGLPTLPVASLGAGELTLSARGVPATELKTDLELKGDQFLASFQGATHLAAKGLSGKGKIQLEAADIEPWLITAGLALPGIGLGTAVEFSAQADMDGGMAVLSDINAVVNEVAIGGDLNAEIKDGIPNLDGALALDELSLDPFVAMVVGESALSGDNGRWASKPFSERTMLPFTASIDISAATLSAGSRTVGDATMSLAVGEEGLRIAGLAGTYRGGKLKGGFELKNNSGTALLSGQLQLTGADLSPVHGTGRLAGRASGSATFSGSGKSVEAIVAGLSGSGTASIRDLRIDGINEKAFGDILARADAVGRDINTKKTAAFAPEIAGQGSMSAGDVDFAFTLANGVLRAPPVTLKNPRAETTAELRADLNTGEFLADGTITYAAGEEALAGSEPALRFAASGQFGATTIEFDSEPLAQFLTQRALEREQARVDAMQALLLERQRLRREVRYYAGLKAERDRVAAEELRKAEEEARRQEEEARQKAAEEARLRAEEEEQQRLQAEEARSDEEAAQQEAEAARRAEKAARQAEEKRKTEAAARAERKRAADAARRAEEERRAAEAAAQADGRPAQPDQLPGVNSNSLSEPDFDVPPPRLAPPGIQDLFNLGTGG